MLPPHLRRAPHPRQVGARARRARSLRAESLADAGRRRHEEVGGGRRHSPIEGGGYQGKEKGRGQSGEVSNIERLGVGFERGVLRSYIIGLSHTFNYMSIRIIYWSIIILYLSHKNQLKNQR